MASIGPQIPPHILNPAANTSTHDDDDGDEEAYGPQIPPQAGPALPPQLANSTTPPQAGPQLPASSSRAGPSGRPPPVTESDDEDAYQPALPPDLTVRAKRAIGPALPAHLSRPPPKEDDLSDDEVGPMPAPRGSQAESATDPVREFMEREERRRKADEEARKPKKLEREEWMLVPPTNSSVLGTLDPTKLKARQFSRSAAPAPNARDNSLWTETPAQRQERLKDEVDGKRKRATDAANDDEDDRRDDREERKRRRHDAEVKAQVEEFNKQTRAHSLVDMHKSSKPDNDKDNDDAPPGIWDHARDMSVGGRLMDDSQRSKMINEARGLGDRFGKGKSGGWL